MSDVEAAWLAAFGETYGLLLISGTGSIAYAKDKHGVIGRAGGLGPDKGDEGSGFWIGKQWKEPLFPLTPQTIRKTAAQAPRVWRLAQRKNSKAQHIIEGAQGHLVDLVQELLTTLKWQGPVPIACAGSVLGHPGFRKGFIGTLKKTLPMQEFRFLPLRTDSATAAARFTMQRYG